MDIAPLRRLGASRPVTPSGPIEPAEPDSASKESAAGSSQRDDYRPAVLARDGNASTGPYSDAYRLRQAQRHRVRSRATPESSVRSDPLQVRPAGVSFFPSSNHNSRHGMAIDALIVHCLSGRQVDEQVQRLNAPESRQSAHYLVDAAGAIVQLVEDDRRAWHVEKGALHGVLTDVNGRSIGIGVIGEFESKPAGTEPPSWQTLGALVKYLKNRYKIPIHNVLDAADVADRSRSVLGGEASFPLETLFQRLGERPEGVPSLPEPAGLGRIPVRRTLRQGSRGRAVVLLQSRLVQGEFGNFPIDGIFGPQTSAAVLRFQSARGLRDDGIVGPTTWALLERPPESAP